MTPMSTAVPRRDPDETSRRLAEWMTARLGVEQVVVSDLSVPRAGFSNETILATARYSRDGVTSIDEVVLRVEPTSHQLFLVPDALRQAAVMRVLAPHVPVPEVLLTESDPTVLGAPFYVMRRVHGRVTPDIPSWHQKGWATALTDDERGRLHDNGLRALVALHTIDTSSDEFGFLETPGTGSALARFVNQIVTMFEWCEPVRVHDNHVLEEAMSFVRAEMPRDELRAVLWGDARMGNIMFGDGPADSLEVAVLMDWEGATLGPTGFDLAWWAMFDEFLSTTLGVARLGGVPDREGTYRRYSDLGGTARDLGYYDVMAPLMFALINSRLAALLVENGTSTAEFAKSIVTRVTGLIRQALDRY